MANEITTPMEPAGRVLPLFRGEYSDSIVYEDPDIVLYENSSYVAKQITIGNPPPKNASSNDYWQMIAKGIIDADISESTVEFTKASERSNIKNGEKTNIIMGKIMKFFADLKDVAFSGSYADLSNKPTIPASAKNGKLTIQKNGTEVQTFTANQSTNAVANILVPTISNSAAVTQTGQMALDAVEKNAAVPGTLAHQVQQVNSNLSGRNPSSITLKRNYDYKTASGWQNILQWYDVNGRTGYLQENIGNGEIKLCLQNERGDILINGNSIAWIANNINNLKSSRNWNIILAAQADGEHEIPVLSGTEALLTLGYVYRIQATMIIPMNIFIAANGEGGKILFSGLTIEVINNTHIKVSGIESDYLFRVFTR